MAHKNSEEKSGRCEICGAAIVEEKFIRCPGCQRVGCTACILPSGRCAVCNQEEEEEIGRLQEEKGEDGEEAEWC